MKLETRLSNRSVKYEEEKKTITSKTTTTMAPTHPSRVNDYSKAHPKLTRSKALLPSVFSTSPAAAHKDAAGSRQDILQDCAKESWVGRLTSCRWTIGYVCCAARFAQVSIRQCIGMAVVCMTLSSGGNGASSSSLSTSPSTSVVDDIGVTSADGAAVMLPQFAWSSDFEALILNAFNFGFFFSPIIGGHLAGRLGGKRVVMVALVVGALATVLLPFAALVSDISVVLLRALAGLFLGVVDPAIQALWAQWAPRTEKGRLTTLSFTGVSLAGIATFFVSAHLCRIPTHNGWPFIFYFFGGFAFLVTIPWVLLVYDSPDQHPRIQQYEKLLIAKDRKPDSGNKKPQTPWRSMARSGPVWAIVVSHATYSWVTSWMMAYLPTYLSDKMHFHIEEDGLYSSLPYVGRMLTGFLCGSLSDRLLRSGIVSTGQCRKIFQVIGCVGCAVCMLGVGFVDKSGRAAAVALLVLALSFQNLTSVAFRINHLDIAPRFAGVMTGISLTVAMAFSLTAPPVTAAILQHGEQEEWLGIFVIVALLNIIGALVFFFFGSGEVQPWALPPEARADDSGIVAVVVTGSGGLNLGSPSANGATVRGERDARDFSSSPAQKNISDVEGGVAVSGGKSYNYDDSGSKYGAEEEQRESFTARQQSNPATKPPAKRSLAHTVSMPAAPYVGMAHKRSLLRKRVSSTDVHQHSSDPKVRQTASTKSSLATHSSGNYSSGQ